MRNNVGLFCNWSTGFLTGCFDSFILLLMISFVALFSIVVVLAFAFPIAFVVNILYGHFLDGTQCRADAAGIHCTERQFIFLSSLGLFLLFHLIDYLLEKVPKSFLKLGQLIAGSTFAFTFIPWFINDFAKYLDWWEILLVIFFTALFWFFVQVLRKYSSLVFLIYIYSYVVYWHVYKEILLAWKYTDERFRIIMIVCIATLAVLSIFGDSKQRIVYLYNR